MFELFAVTILSISLIGISVIVLRKIPVLAKLPIEENEEKEARKTLKEKIKENGKIKAFSFDFFLQKILSRFRVLTLRTDNKTSAWLSELRQRSIKKRENFSGDYWKKIKRRK